MFDIENTDKSTWACFYTINSQRISFFYSAHRLPHDFSICISTQTLIFFSLLYPLLLWGCLCFFLCAGCLFKDWVWHSHGIWCLCDCIKRMCGLRQRWTGTNPAAALHRTAPRHPPTSADLGKCLQCSLKTCHPSHMLWVISLPSLIHPWLCPMKYNTFLNTLIFSHIEKCYFLLLEMVPLLFCLLPLHHSLCSFTSHNANQHLPFWQSSNRAEHYSRALYRQQFCWVIIVYVGRILGDWCISNKEFVTHIAEWALWCPPCWIFCFSSTSS